MSQATGGDDNVVIGRWALTHSSVQANNVVIGSEALQDIDGNNNTAV